MKNLEPYKMIEKLVEERDLAIKQLNSIGVGLGDNMDHVKKALEMQKKRNSKTEKGCMQRKLWDGNVETGKLLCRDCGVGYDAKCVCHAVKVMHFPVEEGGA